jgi:hypothetical protein
MKSIHLGGPPPANPLGALATFGLFRVVCQDLGQPNLQLSWQLRDDWRPVLHLPEDLEQDQLESALLNYLQADQDWSVWSDMDEIKMPVNAYGALLQKLVKQASPQERSEVDRAGAFASEGRCLRPPKSHIVKSMPLDMASGRQKFLTMIQDVRKSILNADAEKLQQFLYGPWEYAPGRLSFGWDPESIRAHGYQARDPANNLNGAKKTSTDPDDQGEVATGVELAIWFAFEALPLLPVAPGRTGISCSAFAPSTGLRQDNGEFRWPVWETPLLLSAVRFLLQSSDLVMSTESPAGLVRLRQRGIRRIYQAQKADTAGAEKRKSLHFGEALF